MRILTPWRLACVAVFALAIAIYVPCLQYPPVWDDHVLMAPGRYGTSNVLLVLKTPFFGNYFRPLTSLSYWCDYHLYGPMPMFWRQTNIAFHALTSLCIVWLAWLATEKQRIAIVAGLIFAVAPSQVAAVAFVGGRTDSQAALFVCLYLALLLSYLKSDKFGYLLASSVCFALAALTKEQTALLVVAAPVAERLFGAPSTKRLGYVSLAFGVVTAIYWWPAHPFFTSKYLTPTSPGLWLHRVLTTLVTYTGLDLIPTPWGMLSISLSNFESKLWDVLGFALWILILLGAYFSIRKNPRVGYFWAVFFLAYLPISNVVTIPSLLVGPYRTGVAAVAVCILLAVSLAALTTRNRWAGFALSGLYLLVCAAGSYWDELQWKDDPTIFHAIGRYDPKSCLGARNTLAADLVAGRYTEGLERVNELFDWAFSGPTWKSSVNAGFAPKISPDVTDKLELNSGYAVETDVVISDFLSQRGSLLVLANSRKDAIGTFESALAVYPKCDQAASSLGDLLVHSDFPKAVRLYELAAKLNVSAPNAGRLGKVRLIQHRYVDAERDYLFGTKSAPWLGDFWVGLADAQFHLGKVAEAQQSLIQARKGLLVDKRSEEVLQAKIQSLKSGAPSKSGLAK